MRNIFKKASNYCYRYKTRTPNSKNKFINFILFLNYTFHYLTNKANPMKYYRINTLDDFQKPCIVYRVIEFDAKASRTYEENIIIFSRKVKRATTGKYNGDILKVLGDSLSSLGYIESTKENYEKEISGKKMENLYPYRDGEE